MTEVDTRGYEKVAQGLADVCGVRAFGSGGDGGRAFVLRQAGALVSTLINISAPANRQRSVAKAQKMVKKQFVEDDGNARFSASGSTVWLGANSSTIFGVNRDYDQRGIDVHEAFTLFWSKQTKKDSLSVSESGKKVVVMNRWLVQKGLLKKVTSEVARRFGRLKAGWIPSHKGTGDKGTVPTWVARHTDGARGGFQSNLGLDNNPHVVLENHAKGVGKMTAVYQRAVQIRIKAMAKDAQLYVRGVKQKLGV